MKGTYLNRNSTENLSYRNVGNEGSFLQDNRNHSSIPIQRKGDDQVIQKIDLENPAQIAPELRSDVAMWLKYPSVKKLVEESETNTGKPLRVLIASTPDNPRVGAHYDPITNSIVLSQMIVATGDKHKIQQSIRWEMQNAEQSATFLRINSTYPNSQTNQTQALAQVYHFEKAEYLGLVREFHDSIREGWFRANMYAQNFIGGKSAKWSSFYKYLQVQISSNHYQNIWRRFGTGKGPMIGEFKKFLTDKDYKWYDYSKFKPEKYAFEPPTEDPGRGEATSFSLIDFGEEDMKKKDQKAHIMSLYDK